MAYLVHANESGLVEIRESGEPDALPLGTAFRKAKLLAGWEVPSQWNRKKAGYPVPEPFCANSIGSRSWTTDAERASRA